MDFECHWGRSFFLCDKSRLNAKEEIIYREAHRWSQSEDGNDKQIISWLKSKMELTFGRAKSGQEIVTVATWGIFKKETNVHIII